MLYGVKYCVRIIFFVKTKLTKHITDSYVRQHTIFI